VNAVLLMALLAAPAVERAEADRPDDHPGAWQVHVLYVEPADREAPRALDRDGTLGRVASAFNRWLRARAGVTLRFDTFHGALDVTHVKLPPPLTEAALAMGTVSWPRAPSFLRERLERELSKVFKDPHKLYLVYYDALAFGHCGAAAWPPTVKGHLVAQFVGGIFAATFLIAPAPAGSTALSVYSTVELPLPDPPFDSTIDGDKITVLSRTANTLTLAAPLARAHAPGAIVQAARHARDCRDNPFTTDGVAAGYWEFSAGHELLHALGIVPRDAAHHAAPPVAGGHLDARARAATADVMYQGDSPWGCAAPVADAAQSPCQLDPAHQEYFKLAGKPAVDLARSVFVEPAPRAAAAPPEW
jgi:hypothetical protein